MASSKQSQDITTIQRPPAEHLYKNELERLAELDRHPRPPGWKLSPKSIITFIAGDETLAIEPKFVGSRSFLERCIVSLATNRGLMLIGEPGTAKSYLSELLAAAISGDSTLTIQGSGGTTEDNIKYSWNYALLLAEGPSERSLVPAPLYRGLSGGQIVRFEEITRCPIEIQDTILSVMSDRALSIPELPDQSRMLYARQGFNIIATANTRDRGINDMSAALKRRFNFETVQPISEIKEEMDLVKREADKLFAGANIPVELAEDVTEVIVTTFNDLRSGKTREGQALEQMTTVMSTAEAISAAYASGLHAYYHDDGKIKADHIVHSLVSTALKDSPDDWKKLAAYFNHAIKARKGKLWTDLYQARKQLP